MKEQDKKRVAVITGAGGTLCSEMASDLASLGITIVLIGRNLNKLKTVEAEINNTGGCAISMAADVTEIDQVQLASDQVRKQFGHCDILINGAGGNQLEAITTMNEYDPDETEDNGFNGRGFFNINLESFESVMSVNTLGTVIPCQLFGRDMARSGGGVIINIASMNSFKPLSRVPAYAMGKAAIINFTQWLAAYLAPANIRVNAIAPGFFLNENSKKRLLDERGDFSERGQNIIKHTPMKRFGKSNELTGCVRWLVDENASGFVTGITVPIDGGFISSSGI